VTDLTGTSFVKICGITSVADARFAAEAGTDAIGLILAESPRRLTTTAARDIAAAIKGTALSVAVFRHNTPEFILEAVDATQVGVVQVHGELPADLANDLRLRGLSIIKALSVTEDEFYSFDETLVDVVLVDGPAPGSGVVHAWPDPTERAFRRPVIAAGGLTPNNVAEFIELTGAWGVDVASGVESSPGTKDSRLVVGFITNARACFARRRTQT
jgi:phosphoribosylanthranilate isomerase